MVDQQDDISSYLLISIITILIIKQYNSLLLETLMGEGEDKRAAAMRVIVLSLFNLFAPAYS